MAALRERRRRHRVQNPSAKRIILVCEECGERLVLVEPPSVWLSRGAVFECECGNKGVTLADRLPDEESGTLRGRRRSA